MKNRMFQIIKGILIDRLRECSGFVDEYNGVKVQMRASDLFCDKPIAEDECFDISIKLDITVNKSQISK